jgi:hypothetical protein
MASDDKKSSSVDDNVGLRARSGCVNVHSRLVSFLYELMRDEVTPGRVEELVRNSSDPDGIYTNGFLANYAIDIARRLGDDPKKNPK